MNVTLLLTLLLSTTVTLQRDGAPVQGEVCRFRADDRENPFRRWLVSQDVTCVPANAPVEFPKGLWNVFARNAEMVSEPVLVDGEQPPPSLSFSMRPAASSADTPVCADRADKSVGADKSVCSTVVYLPRLAVAYPLPAVVPKDEPVWLFTLEKSRIVAMSDGPAVVGWVQIPPGDRRAIENANGLTPPSIRIGSRDADLLPPLEKLHGAFIRVRDVPAGEHELTVSGRGWIADKQRVTVKDAVTVVPESLTVRAAGTLTVWWDTAEDVVALDQSIGSCEDDEAKGIVVSLFACPRPERPGTMPDPDSCKLVRKEPFEPHLNFSSVAFEDLLPGFYRAEFSFGKLPPISGMAPVAPLQLARMNLYAAYLKLYGAVTHGGRPLGETAKITFPGGIGFLPEGKDDYNAAMLRPLDLDTPINVAACDGEPNAIVLTDRPVRPGVRLDLDIPDNALTITVTDTFNREPITNAIVKVEIMSMRMPRRAVLTRMLTVDDRNARAIAKALPERELHVTVSAPGYQRRAIEPFSMSKSEKKELDVQLMPLRGSRARVVSAKPFDSATAYWFAPSGHETERADVAQDGTIVYANEHTPDETLAIVSLSHPLWVVRSPRLGHREGEGVTLRFPDTTPVRTFEVRLSVSGDTVTRQLGMTIGGLAVPAYALRVHQQLRREMYAFRGGPVRVRQILETGPVEVSLDDKRQRLMPEATTVVFPVH